MKLELNIFDIENIRFGEKTAINEGDPVHRNPDFYFCDLI
jgi:hypothetical protein